MAGGPRGVTIALAMIATGAAAIGGLHAARAQQQQQQQDAQGAAPPRGAPGPGEAQAQAGEAEGEQPPLRAPAPERPRERLEAREPRRLELRDAGEPTPGARVAQVLTSSPAAALLRPGDVVVSVDGRAVRSAEALDSYMASLGPGQAVLLEVLRDGQRRFLGVQLTAAPPRPPSPPPRTTAVSARPQVIVVQPAPAAAPQVIEVPMPTGGGAFIFGGGEIGGAWTTPLPPSFAAPGIPQAPGATFAPGPGTSAFAFPQLPGVSQPPGFQRPLRRGPPAPR